MSFGDVAAEHYARIVKTRRAAGAPIERFDALIAATTAANVDTAALFPSIRLARFVGA